MSSATQSAAAHSQTKRRQRLIVTEKTVDHHVSAILRKLAVRTRGQASKEAMRLGLTDRR